MNKKELILALADITSPMNKILSEKSDVNLDGFISDIYNKVTNRGIVEGIYKLHKTNGIGVSGYKKSSFDFVSVEEPPPELDFWEIFEKYFFPRLDGDRKRSIGFYKIFEQLLKVESRPVIIETGCMRVPGNWDGDGQSTFMFDVFCQKRNGFFISIDVNADSIDTARKACSNNSMLILGDSVSALRQMSQLMMGLKADLIYLDSFDVDAQNPMPSAIHHSLEMISVSPMIKSGTIICVDDYRVKGIEGGKGIIVDQFMKTINAEVLHDAYQKAWRVP